MSLERFVKVQESSYEIALKEIKNGRKRSHWMWYIFPQIKGLGYSSTAQYYAIQHKTEAEEYLAHPVLGSRLIEITEELLKIETNDATISIELKLDGILIRAPQRMSNQQINALQRMVTNIGGIAGYSGKVER